MSSDFKKAFLNITEENINEKVNEKVNDNANGNVNDNINENNEEVSSNNASNINSTSTTSNTNKKQSKKTNNSMQNNLEETYTDLNEYVKVKIDALERQIYNEQNRKFGNSKKLKYSDKYDVITIALRREIRDILEELKSKSTLNKYEIIEIILMNGLKNTNFDE